LFKYHSIAPTTGTIEVPATGSIKKYVSKYVPAISEAPLIGMYGSWMKSPVVVAWIHRCGQSAKLILQIIVAKLSGALALGASYQE